MAQEFPRHPPVMAGDNGQNPDTQPILHERLRSQVEYYFSPENLANDTYLRSLLYQADHAGSVPLEVIANFPKIRRFYAAAYNIHQVPLPPADPAVLAQALQGSPFVRVSIDGKWISPNPNPPPMQIPIAAPQHPPFPAQSSSASAAGSTEGSPQLRSVSSPSSPTSQTTAASSVGIPTHPMKEIITVLLRNVPESYEEAQVLGLFSSTSLPPPKSARRNEATVWSVLFDREDTAHGAATGINGQGDIKAEVTKHLLMAEPPSMALPPRSDGPQQVPVQYYQAHIHPQFQYPVMTLPPGYVPYGVPYGVPVVIHPPPVAVPAGYHAQVMPNPPPMQPPYGSYNVRSYPSHVYVRGSGGQGYFQQGQQQQRPPPRPQQQHQSQQEGAKMQHRRRKARRSTSGGSKQSNRWQKNEGASRGPPPPQLRDEGTAMAQSSGPSSQKQMNGNGKERGKGKIMGDSSVTGLAPEHFPALNDTRRTRVQQQQSNVAPKAAYAAALLKPAPAKPANVTFEHEVSIESPSGESTAQSQTHKQRGGRTAAEKQIEEGMSKMNISIEKSAE